MLDQLPTGFTTFTQAFYLKRWEVDELIREAADCWANMKHAQDAME